MSAINFNTVNQTLRQLLGNGLSYAVPRFQRDYSWGEEEWDDFWHDIQETLRPGGEPAHYMGYLVLQTQNQRAYDIIDGQQRLTTISLLVLAVLKALEQLVAQGVDPENNRLRLDQLRSSYIGYLDPVTLIPQTKLALNRNNDSYYRDYLVPLQKLPRRNVRASEHLLRKAFEWLFKKVNDTYTRHNDGAALAAFIDTLADRLFFTVITVTDELNAFKVFETLNSRGVRLSPTDLLKNYLFSVVHRESAHPQEIETLERRWETVVGKLGESSFPDFLRTHWNSRSRFVREAELFKTIRAATPNRAAVFELLRQMDEDLEVFSALGDSEDALWTPQQSRSVHELRMFSVRQPWALLLAAHRAYDDDGFSELLRACSVISFRYNVIGGLSAHEQERVYNGVAQQISSGGFPRAGDALRALAPIYVSDAQFQATFAERELRTTLARNARIVRYILFCIEKHETGVELEQETARYTLEHILPESYETNWPQFTDEQARASVYRLGNLTLLDAATNRDLGNSAFDVKRLAYAESAFVLTRKVAEDNTEWTVRKLADRQRWMARQATAIWRVSQMAQP